MTKLDKNFFSEGKKYAKGIKAIIGEDTYTFGGKDFAGEKGIFGELATARDNGWKLSQ